MLLSLLPALFSRFQLSSLISESKAWIPSYLWRWRNAQLRCEKSSEAKKIYHTLSLSLRESLKSLPNFAIA